MQFLIIRVDATQSIGTGHVMRCLALAQAWQDSDRRPVFLSHCDSDILRQRIIDEGFEFVAIEKPHPDPSDLKKTLSILTSKTNLTNRTNRINMNWFVLDGYHFDPAYQQQIKEAGHRLLVIDDMAHLAHYYADIVMNQNIHGEKLRYLYEPYTHLLLGIRYLLLRREFLVWRAWQRKIPEVARKILVTLGGCDPDNVTLKIIRAINKLHMKDLEIKVVVGPSNPHKASLKESVDLSPFTFHLLSSVRNMAELMAWADMAISAGGSTCWELAFMGLPNLIIVLAENQLKIAKELDTLGIALNLGWIAEISESDITKILKMLTCDQARQKTMSREGRKLVDGSGTDYVLAAMDKIAQPIPLADQFLVRCACFKDAELLWQWANDPFVRANSFHPDPILIGEHIKWYQKKLTSPDTRIWILELNQAPIAQIRYDRIDTNTAEIDFSVAPNFRGRGLGTKALFLTFSSACRELGVKYLKGVVFSSNKASVSAFIKAGFELVGEKQVSDKICDIFIRKCSYTNGDLL